MALLEELKQQIKVTIEPWNLSDDKPPFSPAELITMTMILCDAEPMTEIRILYSIGSHFKHYQHLRRDRDLARHLRNSKLKQSFSRYLHEGFRTLELPASQVRPDIVLSTGRQVRVWLKWEVSLQEARIYLRGALGIRSRGVFPFLRLPPEIRNIIYEMILRFPNSTVMPNNRYISVTGHKEFRTITREYSQQLSADEWANEIDKTGPRRYGLDYRQSVQQTLSLLLVNRQISAEALSCFYGLNLFSFGAVQDLYEFLEGLSSRRQHIRQIMFTFRSYEVRFAVKAIHHLASMARLRKVHIDIDPRHWSQEIQVSGLDKLPSGIGQLRRLRGLEEVIFSSRTPAHIQSLKAFIERPFTRKQKRTDTEIGGRQRYPRKAKSGKMSYA